jgi:hypothetical protein
MMPFTCQLVLFWLNVMMTVRSTATTDFVYNTSVKCKSGTFMTTNYNTFMYTATCIFNAINIAIFMNFFRTSSYHKCIYYFKK